MIWSIRLHMQTMKTPLKNRIFARLSAGRRNAGKDCRVFRFNSGHRGGLASFRPDGGWIEPSADGGGDGTRPHSGQVRATLPKTRHEDAECKRRSKNPSLKRPVGPVAPE